VTPSSSKEVEDIFGQSRAVIVRLHPNFRQPASSSSATLPHMPEERNYSEVKSLAAQSREAVTLRSVQYGNGGFSDFFWSSMDWLFGIDSSDAAAAKEEEEGRALLEKVESATLVGRPSESRSKPSKDSSSFENTYTSLPLYGQNRRSSGARQPLLTRVTPPPDEEEPTGSSDHDSVMSRKRLPPGARYARPKDAPFDYGELEGGHESGGGGPGSDESPPHSLNSRPPYHPHHGVPAEGSRIVESFLEVPGGRPSRTSRQPPRPTCDSRDSLPDPSPAPRTRVSSGATLPPSTASSKTFVTADELPPGTSSTARRSSGNSSTGRDSPTLGEVYPSHKGQQQQPPRLPQPPQARQSTRYDHYGGGGIDQQGWENVNWMTGTPASTSTAAAAPPPAHLYNNNNNNPFKRPLPQTPVPQSQYSPWFLPPTTAVTSAGMQATPIPHQYPQQASYYYPPVTSAFDSFAAPSLSMMQHPQQHQQHYNQQRPQQQRPPQQQHPSPRPPSQQFNNYQQQQQPQRQQQPAQQLEEPHYYRNPHQPNLWSSSSEMLTFIRMNDGKLVRKLSTIASESEPGTIISVRGGGNGNGSDDRPGTSGSMSLWSASENGASVRTNSNTSRYGTRTRSYAGSSSSRLS
jgi:hypothetical protein